MNRDVTTRLIGNIGRRIFAGHKAGQFSRDDLLQKDRPIAGLRHRGGIDIQLHLGLSARQHIGLERWRKHQNKDEAAIVHGTVHRDRRQSPAVR